MDLALSMDLGLQQGGGGAPIPVLNMNFADGSETLDSSVTFTRASTATRVNSSGLIETVSSNTARFDYDPVTLAARGLIMEPAATNMFLYSTGFAANWPKASVAPVDNYATAPDGTTTATRLIDDNGGGTGALSLLTAVTVQTSKPYTFSVYAKADQLSWFALATINFTTPGNEYSYFDLANGVVGTAGAGHTARIEPAGDGWYRCSITFTTDVADTLGSIRLYLAEDDGVVLTVARDGTSSVLIWGAQFEQSDDVSTYIPTSGATATRAAEVAKITGADFTAVGFNGDAGTLFAEAEKSQSAFSVSGFKVPFIFDGNFNALVRIRDGGGANIQAEAAGSNITAGISATSATAKTEGQFYKAAFRYDTNNARFNVDGTISTDLTCEIGAMASDLSGIGIGCSQINGNAQLRGRVKAVKYFNVSLTDEQMDALVA